MKKLIFSLVALVSTSAFAIPVAPFNALTEGTLKSRRINTNGYDFEGIVKLSNCSGYWDRGYSCEIDNFVFRIKEGAWSWTDSIRYTASCDTIGGTSGSPLIAKGERRVIGINNTSNVNGEQCTLNNPCEVSENGAIFFQKGLRYGQQTFNVYTCLTLDFKFDLKLKSCELPK